MPYFDDAGDDLLGVEGRASAGRDRCSPSTSPVSSKHAEVGDPMRVGERPERRVEADVADGSCQLAGAARRRSPSISAM